MVIVISVTIIFLTILVGIVFASAFSRLDHAVEKNQVVVEQQGKQYNPRLTLGFEINPQANPEKQVQEARLLAAKKAASLPRGANMGIGRLGEANLRSAGQGAQAKEDPWTAAKIAEFHGWDGVQSGYVVGAPVAAATPTAVGAAPGGKIKLVPGKDYPVIEITDDMNPADKRKARIANSKAKSAAMKAAKAAGVPAAAPAAVAGAPVATPAAAAPVVPANIEPPQMTPITDDMPDAEKRKARIANSKAKSAFNKALKAAGIDPKTVTVTDTGEVIWPQGAPPAPAAPAAAPVAAAPAIPNIEPPQMTPITDDMPDDEKRKTRIANSKAKSAFNKALKAAGIDPKTVTVTDTGEVIWPEGQGVPAAAPAPQAAPQAPAPAASAPASTESSGADAAAAAGIAKPDLIELTDDMSPDEKRQARIANSKAKSAYNKALKAAGIDPKSVK